MKHIKTLPSQEFLRKILSYDPISGIFTWKKREDRSPQWNGRYAGKIAGTKAKRGYIVIQIENGQNYAAHRLAWIYVNGDGSLENKIIDHRDGYTSDNKYLNLRIATQSQNLVNKNSMKRISIALPKGVYPSGKKYGSRIGKVWLGTFETIAEASFFYNYAAEYHHGEFVRCT